VRAHQAAGILYKALDRLDQLRLGRVRGHVEDEDEAIVQTSGPQMPPVVGESGMVSLVPPRDGGPMDDLPVGLGLRVRVNGHEAIVSIGHPLDPQRPDIDVVLLPGDLREKGRLAGLIG